MKNRRALSVSIVLAAGSSMMLAMSPNIEGMARSQPGMPSGHPSVSMPSDTDGNLEAKPEDVESIESIINAYYDSVSGAKGVTRDWNRFLSLFMPDAQFIISRTVDDVVTPMAMSPKEFVDQNRTYFERGGYFEKDIHHEINSFGHIAQVFSTYASRRSLAEVEPYARGINSILLMNTGDRWWITTIMWESEHIEKNPIPEHYLPEDAVSPVDPSSVIAPEHDMNPTNPVTGG